MSENLHNIDKLFRDGLDNHEDMPSAKVWDSIDAGLDKSNVVDIKRKYKNLKRIAAVLLLLLLSGVGYEVFKTKSGNKDVLTKASENNKNNTGTEKPNTETNKNTGSNLPGDNNATAVKAQTNTIANAGFDSLKENVSPLNPNTVSANKKEQYAEVNENAKSTSSINATPATDNANTVKQNTKKQKGNLPVADDNTNDAYNSRISSNKIGSGKTKIKIRRPQPQLYDNVDENGEDESAILNTSALTALQNTPATLAERINKAIDAGALPVTNRQSPDAAVKKLRNSKAFHFNIMPFFSPQFTSNYIKEESKGQWTNTNPGGPPPPRPDRQDHKEQYKDDEQQQNVYSMGVLAEVPIGKRWSVQSGITYLNKTINIEPKKIYARTDKDGKVKYVFDCSSGYSYIATKTGTAPAVGDSITATTSKNSLGYIGVPLSVNYKFSLGKFSIIPGVGTVLNFLTKKKIETELVKGSTKEQQTTNKIDGLKSSYLNATAGVAVEYSVNKRIALNVMPSGNFALTSINNSDAAVKSYPNAFAVSAGVKIKF